MARDLLTEADGLWEYAGKPTLPLRAAGEIVYRGWDIPDRWVVDGEFQPWATRGAHGGPLFELSGVDLIAMAETDPDREAICDALGVEPRPTLVKRLRTRIEHLEAAARDVDGANLEMAAAVLAEDLDLENLRHLAERLAGAALRLRDVLERKT